MSETTFQAATEEAALAQAVEALGVSIDELEHEIVETKRDFWGGDEEIVVIKAWKRASAPQTADRASAEAAAEALPPVEAVVEAPGREAQGAGEPAEKAATETAPQATATDAPSPESQAVPQESSADAASPGRETEPPRATTEADVGPEDVKALLAQILHDMEFDCSVEISVDGEGFMAQVDGLDQDALLEGNGRGLAALELIVNNAFRHKLPRGSKVTVDAGDFRSRRNDEFSDLALQVAHSAKQSGRTQETQPLNPYERRLVHLALADDARVTTRSKGDGFLKNVQVIPATGDHGRRARKR